MTTFEGKKKALEKTYMLYKSLVKHEFLFHMFGILNIFFKANMAVAYFTTPASSNLLALHFPFIFQ